MPELKQYVEYQWQALRGKLWSNDGKEKTSYSQAIRYLDVAANCKDCDGHRLIMTVYNGLARDYRVRLLYTLNSRPKG